MAEVLLLSLLQGVAEFLPVSSSGHLVIGQWLLGIREQGVLLDVMLHLGTLVSIMLFYRRMVIRLFVGLFVRSGAVSRREAWEYLGKIIVSALPAVAVYLIFHDFIYSMFENAKMVGALLMFTGAVLIGTRYMPRGGKTVSWWRALLMGLGQALALLPGVSRSGMTLACARAGGVDAEKSAEFSFLMSAPLIAGAVLLEAVKGGSGGGEISWGLCFFGAAISAIIGYISLKLLVKALKGRWFWLFGPYCLAAGLLTLILV